MIDSPTRRQAELLLIVAALIWGVALYFQKSAMAHVGPLLFLALRAVVAAVALAPFAVAERSSNEPPGGSVVPIALAGGMLFFAAASLQQFGLVTATVSNAGFLTALYVVVTPFIAWLLRRRPPTTDVWIAAALAFAGTWALGGGSLHGLSGGDWLIATSAVLWATYLVVTGESGRFGRPVAYTCTQFVVVAVVASSAALLFEPISVASIRAAATSILYVGLLSSALTFAILSVALRQVPASRAAVLMSLDTVSAALAGYVLLGERLSVVSWVGAALMVAAVLTVTTRRAEAECR